MRLPDGALLASHDYFGQLFTLEGENGLTSIYRSEDDGQTWLNITHIINAYWGTLISLPDAVYHIGVTRDYGDIVVHIFQEEIRHFYNIEDLWADAKKEIIENED